MTLDDGHGYAEHDDDAVEHAAALDETAPVGDAGADAAAAAPADGWSQGAFEFDDSQWEEAAVAAEADEATSGWTAEFDPDLDGTSVRPPLPDEHVQMIKSTMATLDIAPPEWVRKMQTMQRIQQMQQQMQQMQADDAAKPSGPLALPGGAQAASLAVAEQAWAQQLQQRTPGGHLLSAATIADASPLAAPPSAPSAPPSTLPGLAGMPGTLSHLTGVSGVQRKATSKQLAAERQKARAAKAGRK